MKQRTKDFLLVLGWGGGAAALLFCSPSVGEGVRQGLAVCAAIMIPSLFPFLILSDFLGHTRIGVLLERPLGGLMARLYRCPKELAPAILMSWVGGYPAGARVLAGMVERGALSQEDAGLALTFCVNSGPAFLAVVVGAGVDHLLSLLLQMLPEQRAIALEDPGYPAAYAAASLHGLAAIPIPVDRYGMDPEALAASGAGLAYITPSHQFPLGVTMPAGRRSRLLHWAASGPDRFLIEDDYDSEFRYSSRPIPALQGLDQAGRVVYIGTFSRSIAPAIRVAYMILPPPLLKRYQDTFSHRACAVSRFEQESLRRFITQGLYGRHLRRMGTLYRKKCALFTGALSQLSGASLSGAEAGLHFLLTLPRYSEEELTARAAEKSVRVYPLSRYCHSLPPPPSTVVLGFAGLSEEEISRAAALLRAAWS